VVIPNKSILRHHSLPKKVFGFCHGFIIRKNDIFLITYVFCITVVPNWGCGQNLGNHVMRKFACIVEVGSPSGVYFYPGEVDISGLFYY
jgi:hypothetical protein